MTTYVSHLADRSPDDPMMVTAERTWSTSEFLARAGGAAAWLDNIDAAPGTPVPAVVWASPEAIILVLGGAQSQRPLAPLGPQLTARELAACLTGIGAAVLVAEESTAQLATEAAAAAGLRLAVMPPDFVPNSSLPLTAEPDDIFAILHTSGTSGVPKRVPMQQGRLGGRAMAAGALMGCTRGIATSRPRASTMSAVSV
jgi:acyl-CoA synthetase (AMP-forming)/AMP-acid ligase II